MPRKATLNSQWSVRALAVTLFGALLATIGMAAVAPKGSSSRGDSPTRPTATSHADGQPTTRLREGTVLENQLGHFEVTGDRFTFYSDDGAQRYVMLENQGLERVSRLVGDGPTALLWNVDGEITEFRGANFLMLRRAVLKSAASSPP